MLKEKDFNSIPLLSGRRTDDTQYQYFIDRNHNYFKDYKPNKFLFGSKGLFYNNALDCIPSTVSSLYNHKICKVCVFRILG